MRIKLAEFIGPKCVALDDGRKLYEKVFPELKEKQSVELDFEGVDLVFSPFLMGLVGKLLDHFEKETILSRLQLCRISEEHLKTVNDFIDRTELQAGHQHDVEAMRELFEEDELGDL